MGFSADGMSVTNLIPLLMHVETLEPEAVIVGNQLGNLAIMKNKELIGFIDVGEETVNWLGLGELNDS